MPFFLYLYDCRRAREINARRVSFTKELYGYTYSWKTKTGIKQRKKPGLIDMSEGAYAVADSAILVPGRYRSLFDSLFASYSDIMKARVFEVIREIS
ncbi:MAG: hypothetical protein ACXABV_05220 [Candidatus Thorarchaeota archaeon]|jgi:hypothetical protein